MTRNIKSFLGIKLVIAFVSLLGIGALFNAPSVSAAAPASATWKDKATLTAGGIDYKGPKKMMLNIDLDGNQMEFNVFLPASGTTILLFRTDTNLDTATTTNWNNSVSAIDAVPNIKLTNTRASAPDAPATPGGTTSTETGDAESCNVSGIGWIICPVAGFLASVADGAYAAVEQLMVFKVSDQPFSTDPKVNPTFAIWSSVRNLANVLFIIAFFVVIFSQATSIGLSNYGIKKMLPRIIVSAILVNLSYYLCLFAVDVSNIVGAGIDGVVNVAIQSIPGDKSLTWEIATANILTGVVGGVALGVFAITATGTLFAFLTAAVLAILTALAVLAARQAFLFILIILAPLAFVAYILPNTEGLFDKWRKAFVAMLVMYPLVAIIFAGSQVAAFIIRSTAATTPGYIGVIMNVISLGVMALPLFALPFIVKFSGGVLGRVAGMVNNPNKGLIDRARKRGDETAGVRARKAMQQESSVRRSKNFYAAMAGKTGPKAAFTRGVGRAGMTGLGRKYITPGGRADISSSTQNISDQYRKIQTEETNRALASITEHGAFQPGTTYTVKDASGSAIATSTNPDDMVKAALANKGSRVEFNNGVNTETFATSDIKSALMSKTAQLGNVGLTEDIFKMDAETAAGMREFVSYNGGAYATKAPDFVKGAVGAFRSPKSEELLGWHPKTAARAAAYASTDAVAADNIAITINQTLKNSELRGKLNRDALRNLRANPDIYGRLSPPDQADLDNFIATGV